MAKFDIHKQITSELVATIERGDPLPWNRPWDLAPGSSALPFNAKTGNAYSGGNIIALWLSAMVKGYRTNEWATFKQWRELGTEENPVHVRKGEKCTVGVFYSTHTKTKVIDGQEMERSYSFARAFRVFNRDQVEGLPALDDQLPVDVTENRASFDRVVATLSPDLRHGGNRAYFNRGQDFIQMPNRAQFQGVDGGDPTTEYYATLAHELTHWTGHKRRLDREFGKRFGDQAYAIEELTAELGAAFTLAEHGMQSTLRHAGYLSTWLEVLKADPRALFIAASAASKASVFIHSKNQGKVAA